MAGLTDDEVFGPAPQQGMSDTDVFSSGLSDEEVFSSGPSLTQRLGQSAVRSIPVVGPAIAGFQAAGEYGTEAIKGVAQAPFKGVESYLKGRALVAPQPGMGMPQLPGESDLEYNLRLQDERERVANIPVQDSPVYKAGETVGNLFSEQLNPSKEFEGSWTRDIAGGLGSVATNVAATLVGGPGAGAEFAIRSGQGEAVQRAVQDKATPAQTRQAGELGGIAGAGDLVDSILPVLGSTGKAMGLIYRVGRRALLGAFAEGGTEGVQQLIQNAIAQGVYKPDQDIFEDVPRAFVVGAIVGGGVTGVLGGQSSSRNVGGDPATGGTQSSVDVIGGAPSAAQLAEAFNVLRGSPLEVPAANAVVASMTQPWTATVSQMPQEAIQQAPLQGSPAQPVTPQYQPQTEEERQAYAAGYARKEIATNATPEQQEAWRQGALARTERDLQGAPPPPDKYRGFVDTRGQGRRFMGSGTEIDLKTAGHRGSPVAIYGNNVTYTTEALDIAHGYANRRGALQPTVYEVIEKRPTTLYDMDAPMTPEVRARISEIPEALQAGIDQTATTLREAFDAIRHQAASNQTPANEVQERAFNPVIDFLADSGFDGMTHLGGEKTKHPLHKVTIWFPQRDAIEIRRMDAKELEEFQKPPEAQPTQEQVFRTPGPLRRLLAAPDLTSFARIAKELGIQQNDPRFGQMLDEWMEARRLSGTVSKGSVMEPLGPNADAPRVSYSLGTSPVEGDYRPTVVYVPGDSIRSGMSSAPALNGTIFTGGVREVATVDGRPFAVETLHSAPLVSFLNDIRPTEGSGSVHNLMFFVLRERIKNLAGDTMVHIVMPETLLRIPGMNETTLGVTFTKPLRDLVTGKVVNNILLRADLLSDPQMFAHTFMHEAFHAVSAHELFMNEKFQNDMQILMDSVSDQFTRIGVERYQGTHISYIFSSPDEFLAEAFSNSAFQFALANIKVPRDVWSRLGLENEPTVWQAFIQLLRKFLALEGNLEMYSLLEATARIGTRVIDAQARLPFDPARPDNASFVIGVEENTKATRIEGGSNELEGFARQPEVTGTGDMIRRAVGTGPINAPLQQVARAQVAQADRINWLYKIAAGLDQLTRANPNFKPLVDYKETVVKMDGVSATLQEAAVAIGKRWLGLGRQADNLASLMEDFVHMEYRSPAEKQAQVVRMPTPQEFNQLVQQNKVNAAGLKVFNDVKLFSDGLHNLIERSLIQRVTNRVQDPIARARRIKTIQDKAALLRQRPYFPFTNFGSHYILIQDPSGALVHFQTYERQGLKRAVHVQSSAAKAWAREWEKQYGRAPVMGQDIKVGVLPEHVKPLVGMPGLLLEEMSDVMQLTEAQINTAQWLQLAEAAGDAPMLRAGAQKMFFKPRYGFEVPGYSLDLRRSFSRFAFHGARYYSRIEHLDALREAIKRAELVPDVRANEIAKFMTNHLEKTVLDARGDFGNIRGAMFFIALGYVPQAATQNMFQTPMLTFPFLWDKFGAFKTKWAISKAMVRLRDFYHRNNYNDQKLASPFWERAIAYGIRTKRLKETMAADLVGMSQASLLQGVGGDRTFRYWRHFVEKAAYMFETVEQYNRWIAFMAALELAENNPNAKYIGEAVKEHPIEYEELKQVYGDVQARALITAINTVEQTQFNYSRVMRPKLFRGPIGATVFIFKNFMRSTLWTLGHNPTMIWKYALVAGILGGLSGLPFSEEIQDLIRIVGRFFGKEWDVQKEARKLVRDYLSNVVDADVLLHGFARRGFGVAAVLDLMGSFATGTPGRGLAAPRYTTNPETGHPEKQGFAHNVPFPVLDRSRAISMGQVLPFDLGVVASATDDPNRTIATQAQQASGAIFSLAFNIYRALFDQHLSWGDPKRWEKVVPAQLGNMSKAWRAYSEGRERTRGGPNGGTTVVPYDTRDPEQMMEILAIAAGYRPLRESARWDVTMRKIEAEKRMQLQRSGLYESFYEAASGGIDEEIDTVIGQIEKFNNELPEEWSGMAINGKSLRESLKQRSQGRLRREMGIPPIRGARPAAQDIESLYPEASTDVSVPIRR